MKNVHWLSSVFDLERIRSVLKIKHAQDMQEMLAQVQVSYHPYFPVIGKISKMFLKDLFNLFNGKAFSAAITPAFIILQKSV